MSGLNINEDGTYTPPPIDGYRNLDVDEVDALNSVKRMERMILAALSDFDKEETGITEKSREAKRWFAIAKTHFEQGFMATSRGIAKPDNT